MLSNEQITAAATALDNAELERRGAGPAHLTVYVAQRQDC